MLEVQKVRPIRVNWHVMSLAVLNEGRELPQKYRDLMDQAWAPVRVAIAASTLHGNDIVGDLYTEMGTRIHPGGQDYATAVRDAVEALNLPPEVLNAGESEEFDEKLRASHAEGIAQVGEDVGTPVISVPGPPGEARVAFFGPVVTPAPKGEDAGRLWDGVLLVAGTPGFFELKRTRTREPQFD